MSSAETKVAGWTAGHRVWFRETWDGLLLARKYAGYAAGMKIADETPDPYGRILVSLGDGTPERVVKAHLRLTPPPSATGKEPRPRTPKPKARKEAIAPEHGTETTIFDHMEA